jgi:hypothetical protein
MPANASDPRTLGSFAISQLRWHEDPPRPWGEQVRNATALAEYEHSRKLWEVQCALTADAFSTVPSSASSEDPASLDFGMGALAKLLVFILPESIASQASVGQVAVWWSDGLEKDMGGAKASIEGLISTCSAQICMRAGDRLDPDVSGIGVSSKNPNQPSSVY